MKEHFFYRSYWLFYLLFFLLLGWLIYALLWKPYDCTSEINDLKNRNNSLITQVKELGDKNKNLSRELDECKNDAKNNIETPQQTVDCNATVNSGGQGFTSTNHRLGKNAGNVVIQFDADNIPDEFTVIYDGKVVANSGGLVSHEGTMSWQYKAENGKPDFSTVEVSAPQNGTSWNYLVNCPQ